MSVARSQRSESEPNSPTESIGPANGESSKRGKFGPPETLAKALRLQAVTPAGRINVFTEVLVLVAGLSGSVFENVVRVFRPSYEISAPDPNLALVLFVILGCVCLVVVAMFDRSADA